MCPQSASNLVAPGLLCYIGLAKAVDSGIRQEFKSGKQWNFHKMDWIYSTNKRFQNVAMNGNSS